MLQSLHDLQKAFFESLVSNQSSDVQGHFHVYQNAYRLRLRETIEQDFTQSLKLISPETRDQLFKSFFQSTFSESYTLNALGAQWLQHLRRTNIMLPEWYADFSEFEWELTLALYRESDPNFKPRSIDLGSVETQVFLAPAARLICSRYPLAEWYRQGEIPKKSYVTKNHWFAIWRESDESHFTELNEFTAYLLEQLLNNRSLIEIANSTNQISAELIQSAFQELSENGILNFN